MPTAVQRHARCSGSGRTWRASPRPTADLRMPHPRARGRCRGQPRPGVRGSAALGTVPRTGNRAGSPRGRRDPAAGGSASRCREHLGHRQFFAAGWATWRWPRSISSSAGSVPASGVASLQDTFEAAAQRELLDADARRGTGRCRHPVAEPRRFLPHDLRRRPSTPRRRPRNRNRRSRTSRRKTVSRPCCAGSPTPPYAPPYICTKCSPAPFGPDPRSHPRCGAPPTRDWTSTTPRGPEAGRSFRFRRRPRSAATGVKLSYLIFCRLLANCWTRCFIRQPHSAPTENIRGNRRVIGELVADEPAGNPVSQVAQDALFAGVGEPGGDRYRFDQGVRHSCRILVRLRLAQVCRSRISAALRPRPGTGSSPARP